MKKLILASILMMILVGIIGVVFADFDEGLEYKYQEVSLEKGWNLVSIYSIRQGADIDQSNWDREQIKKQNIKAIFFYDPYNKEYIRTYPDIEKDKLQEFVEKIDPEGGGDIDAYWRFTSSSMWVYSNERQTVSFGTTDGPAPINYITLKSGWNFLTITPEMTDKSLKDIEGSCSITKAYLWDAQNQQWGTIFNLLDDRNILKNEGGLWNGLIVKVPNDCTLGSASGRVSPPELP